MGAREEADRGAGFVEYAALIVLAALILGGLVELGLPSRVRTVVSQKICQILHAGNAKGCGSGTDTRADPYKPKQPCTVSSSSTRYGGDVTFASVDIGGGVTLVEQEDSQGHVTVTAVSDTSAKAAVGAGAGYQWGKAVNVGVGVGADGGGTIRTGDSWTFDNKKQADAFTGEIKKEAYANEAEQSPIFGAGPIAYAYKHSPWKPKVRQPDVTRYSVDFGGSASVNGGANVGPGKTPSSKSGSQKGGKHQAGKHEAGKHKAGKHEAGKHKAESKSGRTDGRKSADPDIAQGNGKVTLGQQETVEVDHKHHTVSASIDVHVSATANGDVAGHAAQPDHPEGVESDGAVKVTVDAHGNVIGVDMTQTQTVNGKTTVTTTHLPVTDANRTQVVEDLGLYGTGPAPLPTHLLWNDLAPTEDPGDAGNDFQRQMYEHGQTTKVTYDTSSSDNPVNANVKAGLEFGLGGDESTQDQKVTDAEYLGPPGPDGKRHYQKWKECR